MTAVTYELDGAIARITMDDGKVNALSPELLDDLRAALDEAEGCRAVIVPGRSGMFSAGFSLPVLQGGGRKRRGCWRAVSTPPGGCSSSRPRW